MYGSRIRLFSRILFDVLVIEARVLGFSTGFLFSPVDVIGGVSALDDNSDTGLGVDWLVGGVKAGD